MPARTLLAPLAAILLASATPAQAEATTIVPQLRHTQEVEEIRWARDGSFLVSAARDATVKVWTPDGWLLRTLHIGTMYPRIALSPDGAFLLVADHSKKALDLWSTAGKRVRRLPEIPGFDQLGEVAWSPTGDALAVCSHSAPRHACEVLDPEGRSIARLELPGRFGARGVAFSPDGQSIFTASGRSVNRWSRGGERLSGFEAPEEIAVFALSPDGARIATSGGWELGHSSKSAVLTHVFDLTGKSLARFPSHETKRLEFSADGRWIVSGGERDGRIFVNDAANGHAAAAIKLGVGGMDSPAHVALAPDGTRFAVATHDKNAGLRFVDLAGQRAGAFAAVGASLIRVALDPTGQMIVTTSGDGKVRLWTLDGRLVRRFDSGDEYPTLLEVDPLGRFIVTGSNALTVWDGRGKALARTRSQSGWGTGLSFARDGEMLWTADSNGWVTGLPLTRKARPARFLPFGKNQAWSIAVQPQGELVAVGGFGRVKLFDGTGAPRGELQLPSCQRDCAVVSLAFTADGRVVGAGWWAGGTNLFVYDLEGHLSRSAATGGRYERGATAVSPGGRWFAAAHGHDIVLYELSTMRLVARLRGHRGSARSVAFTRDERHLVSGGADGTVRVWNTESGASMALFSRGDDWAIFTDDGLFDASARGGDLLALVDGMAAFGVDQVALRLNRPDLIYQRVGIGDEGTWDHLRRQHEERLRRAGISAEVGGLSAPRVRMLSHRQEGGVLELTVGIDDATHALQSLQLWANGVPLLPGHGRPLSGSSATVTERIRLGAGTNRVEASARNEAGFESRRAGFSVEGPRSKPATLWFVGLGVSKYVDPRLNLRFADHDVKEVAAALRKARGRFGEVRTLELVNERATRGALEEISAFLAGAATDDTVVLLASGHGARDPGPDGTFRFVTHEADPANLASTTIAGDELESVLAETPARRRLLLVDACQSGEVDPETLAEAREAAQGNRLVLRTSPALSAGVRKRRPYLLTRNRYSERHLERRTGVVVFSSSLGEEVSMESAALQGGVFTTALVRVLAARDADRNHDGWLDANELENAVKATVVTATDGLQHPVVDQDNDLADLRLPVLR